MTKRFVTCLNLRFCSTLSALISIWLTYTMSTKLNIFFQKIPPVDVLNQSCFFSILSKKKLQKNCNIFEIKGYIIVTVYK